MPCYGPTPEQERALAEEAYQNTLEELDKVTRLLCELCTVFDKEGLRMTGEQARWWLAHEKLDAKRKKAQARAAKEQEQLKKYNAVQEKKRKAALKKLTAAEKKLLGI